MLAFFLIVTFFAGIGYQLRHWLGRQQWYMGLGFVLILYVPGFIVALFGLMAYGMSFEAARRFAGSPVLCGLLIGAFYLSGSEDWLVEFSRETENRSEEGVSSHEAKRRRTQNLDEQKGRRWSLWRELSWNRLQLTRGRTVTIMGMILLLGGLAIALHYRQSPTKSEPKQLIDTREVPVELPELPRTATLRVPAVFSPASSALERAKQKLILNTGETRPEYSQILSRDWDKEFSEIATLSIGQLSSLKDHQGKIALQQWKKVLEKARTPSPKFQRRVDSLQSRIEEEKNAPGFQMTSPTTTVRDGNVIVYKTIEVELNDKLKRQLMTRKIMYDSKYSVFAEIALTIGSDAPVDSLQEYVRAISFSAE